LPLNSYRLNEQRGEYLAVLGRVSPEKGIDRAIEIATHAGIELRIAAKVDAADRDYYEEVIHPLLDHPGIKFLGEIGEQDKQGFLGDALALLFPIEWPEPFGLVMIEAMACGTPIIAFRRGSVPELVDDGVTGFNVETVSQAIEAIGRVHQIDRRNCRQV